MPKICQWHGIAIEMYRPDHPPPHFHALYAECEARNAIDPLVVLTSDLPRQVLAWAAERRAELRAGLLENWKLCRRNLPLRPIPPL